MYIKNKIKKGTYFLEYQKRKSSIYYKRKEYANVTGIKR
jgi:hypothetical protein